MPISSQYAKFLEGHANTLREKCALPPFARLDPFVLARLMELKVCYVGEKSGLPDDLLKVALGEVGGSWDAGTLKFPDGRIFVFMNPMKQMERQHATLMEEIAHVHLDHKPTEIISCGGIVFRTCSKTNEGQAYWLGATALLPARILKGARTLGKTIKQVASEHQVSTELVQFRCKVLNIQLQPGVLKEGG